MESYFFYDVRLSGFEKLSDEQAARCTAIHIVIFPPLISTSEFDTFVASLHTLSTKVPISTLNLSIICQCGVYTERLLADGLAHFHGLRNLGLKLSYEPDPAAQALARSAVLSLTQPKCAAKPFPYTRLPTELRQRILSFTALVVSSDYYNGPRNYPLHSLTIIGKRLVYPNPYAIHPFSSCCDTCIPSYPSTSLFANSLRLDAATHCVCHAPGGGGAAYSSTCSCALRSALLPPFLTSRLLNADATYVCFSQNRFVLSSQDSAEDLAFLRSLPDAALAALRRLDVRLYAAQVDCFSVAGVGEDGVGREQRKAFAALVALVAEKCFLPGLHFTLDTGFLGRDYDFIEQEDESEEEEDERPDLLSTFASDPASRPAPPEPKPEPLAYVRAAYRRLADALVPLRGLDRLEIYFSRFFEEEDAAEKRVMGEGYDALARGKILWSERWPLDPHVWHDAKKLREEDGDDEEDGGCAVENF